MDKSITLITLFDPSLGLDAGPSLHFGQSSLAVHSHIIDDPVYINCGFHEYLSLCILNDFIVLQILLFTEIKMPGARNS